MRRHKMLFCNLYQYEIYIGTFVSYNGKVWLQNIVNVALQSLPISYIFVLRRQVLTIYDSKVAFFPCEIQKYTKFVKFVRLYFCNQTLQFYLI